ncbi:MAG: hypothetical protein K2G99_06755 [Desulfovibrio sp.]|nr:hypothetical protein [Desulfovibrio sp.]
MKGSWLTWLLVGGLLFLGGLSLTLNRDYRALSRDLTAAKKELSEATQIIQTMKQEHDCAIKAANAALKAREEEHARTQKRIAEAERVLEDNGDFSGLVLPDDIARLFYKSGNVDAAPGCDLPAPGGAAR